MAASTENGFEAMAFAGNKTVKEQFDRAMAAFGEFNSFGKSNVEALVESVSKTGETVEKINSRVMSFSKDQMEEGVAVARRFASVKSVQELIELQTSFAKSSMDAYIGEVNALSDIYAGAVKEAVKPLNERMAAAAEAFQVAR